MHQRNSHHHHYFRTDVSGGRDETTDRVSQLPHSFIFDYLFSRRSDLVFHLIDSFVRKSNWATFFWHSGRLLDCCDFLSASLLPIRWSKSVFYAITPLHVRCSSGHSYGLRPSLCKRILYYVKIHTDRPVHDYRPPGLTIAFGAHVFANTPCSHSNSSDETCKKGTLCCFMFYV